MLVFACSSDDGVETQAPAPVAPQARADDPAFPPTSDLQWLDVPRVEQPSYLAPIRDPTFRTRVVRISDQTAFATAEPYLRHMYAKNQPWNADGSLLMLAYTYPAAVMDARSFQLVRWIHQPSRVAWMHNDPVHAIGTFEGTNQLVIADMSIDGKLDVIHSFEEYSEISFGAGEGNVSNDDRYIALFGFADDRSDLFVFDLVERRTVGTTTFGAARVCDCYDPRSINNATMSQSGAYVVVQYNEEGTGRYRGIEAFDRQMNFVTQVTPTSHHGDVGLTLDGRDVWVAYESPTYPLARRDASAYAWNLADGAATAVIPRGTTQGHISCRNVKRPGYCYASHSPEPRVLATDQLYAFPLDGSMRMQVFAHHRSTATAYLRQSMGVPSPDGTKVLWASDWGDGSAPVHAYVATTE